MFNKNLEQMNDEELLKLGSDIVYNNASVNGWKYEQVESDFIVPDFMGGAVEFEDNVLHFNVLNMKYYLEDNELFIGSTEIELNSKLKPKNKEAKKLFKGFNSTDKNENEFFQELKTYIKDFRNNNILPVHKLIYNMVEVMETGSKTNDLIQAVKNLLMEAELQRTYNGFVMPLKNNVCRPIRLNEIFEFIEDVCNVRGISSDTVKGALSYFNREVEPTFNCIVTGNGYYDFEEGMFYEKSDEPIVIKKASPYNYREELIGTTPPELLNKFLYETFSDDLNKVEQLLEIFGYMLDDGNMYQIMPFFSGKGRNGKGVCLDLLSKLVDDNTSAVDIFSVDFGSKYSSPLVESDINIINEVKSIKNLAEVKEYIGQGGLHLAKIYEQGRKYEDIELPKTILATNNFKGLEKGVDYALMKRLGVFIEFNNIVPEDKQNPFLLKELVGEADSMDWLLTNSIYSYQQIRNKGVSGSFMAGHNADETFNHLEKYINPVVYAIKNCFHYDVDEFRDLAYNSTENWDKFVSQEDIINSMGVLNYEIKLGNGNKNLKEAVCDAFGLTELKYGSSDEYKEGVFEFEILYNYELEVKKTVIVGVLRC